MYVKHGRRADALLGPQPPAFLVVDTVVTN
jgi:hypothetical protein